MIHKRTPPAFIHILDEYEAECPDKTLRVGQWFYNQFLSGATIDFPHNLDLLYNSTDYYVISQILDKIYVDYQRAYSNASDDLRRD